MERWARASRIFFFNGTATTEIYTLSLHDALPICPGGQAGAGPSGRRPVRQPARRPPCPSARTGTTCRVLRDRGCDRPLARDRKSTRLNSSHANISYAVFCLKKKYYYLVLFICPPP